MYNSRNERIKREYFRFLKEANRKSDNTLDQVRKAISRFEEYNKYKDFITFNKDQAIAFKKYLSNQKNQRTGEPISKSTMLSTLNALQDFFRWLVWQAGYKAHIHVPDIEYFNMTDKEVSIAKARKHKNFPSMEQIRNVIFAMPVENEIQRRNRALIAFAILTGMRDSAIASIRLQHIDLSCNPVLVRQEPNMVKTKFSKQIFTFFFPIGDDIEAIFLNWFKELRENKLFGECDPVFPRTKLAHDKNQCFSSQGLETICWATTTPIRNIFRQAFEEVGLPYFNPHSFRDTLTHIGQQVCKTPEEMKAWSQNLGHEEVLTTFTSYGNIATHRQGEIIRSLAGRDNEEHKLDKILNLISKLNHN